MSRYVIWTSDENLEVFTGFDEGMEGFFLTIADARTCTGEAGSYLFHNLDHHHTPQMTLDEVATVLARFGLTLPATLHRQLEQDKNVVPSSASDVVPMTGKQPTGDLDWQRAG